MESWEWNKVDSKFSEIRVKLTWESDRAGDTRHGNGDKMVQITVGWGGELKSSETDIVESFIIDNLDFIGVLNKLMDRKSSIIRFNDGIGDFWGWEDGEGLHNSVGIFLSDLGDQKGTHTGSGTTTEGVGDLETLEAIATFSFLSDDVEDGVNKFSTFSVMAFSPVVTSSSLAEDEVVGSEKLAEWSSSDGVHCSWFEIHEDGSWDKSTSSGFIIVDVDSLELEIGVTMIGTGWVNTVFVGNDFPEFGTDLVTALACLNVDKFSHFI